MGWQYFFVLLAGFVAVLVQTTVAPYFLHGRLIPDFFFVMVVMIGLFKKSMHGAAMAFLLGAMEDLFSSEVFGLYMCSRMIVYFLASRLRQRFSPNEPLGQVTIALGLGAFDKAIIFILLYIFSSGPKFAASDMVFPVMEVGINALLLALLYPLFAWVPGLLDKGLEVKSG